MGTKVARLPKLEAQAATEPIERSAEQLAAIEAVNPCFRERHVETTSAGEEQPLVGNAEVAGGGQPNEAEQR